MILMLFILRTLVYFQSFIWLYILFSNWKIKDYQGYPIIPILFINAGIISYFQILRYNISFSQYTSELLGLYILMVLLCFGLFYSKYSFKDSVALAFLIVFINSYYWESMLHFNAIVFSGFNFNQIIQMFHLFPAYFLIRRIEFHNLKNVKKLLIYGLIVSSANVSLIMFGYRSIINPLTRIITLGILITIVLDEIKEIKKGV